jgi:hypothetical protein
MERKRSRSLDITLEMVQPKFQTISELKNENIVENCLSSSRTKGLDGLVKNLSRKFELAVIILYAHYSFEEFRDNSRGLAVMVGLAPLENRRMFCDNLVQKGIRP